MGGKGQGLGPGLGLVGDKGQGLGRGLHERKTVEWEGTVEEMKEGDKELARVPSSSSSAEIEQEVGAVVVQQPQPPQPPPQQPQQQPHLTTNIDVSMEQEIVRLTDACMLWQQRATAAGS